MASTVADLVAKLGLDNTDFIRGVDKSLKSFEKMGAKMQNVGKTMTIGVTLPLLALGVASVKAASDSQETSSKFNTVFRDIASQAEESFGILRNEYGQSSTAARQMLSDTGDLLTGFGFSQEAALGLSTQVGKLAVDLASFTNFSGGAKGAADALTKALLGERESVKALGISILEEDVKKQMAINTAKGMTFETERQAKAQATLDIALSQSTNAIGDYARTSGDFANQFRLLQSRTEDLANEFGAILLPIAAKLVAVLQNAIATLSQLNPETKQTILIFAGLAAAIGPLLVAVGFFATTLLPSMISGFTLLMGPIGIVIAGALVLTGVITALSRESNKAERALNDFKKSNDELAAMDNKLNPLISRYEALSTNVFRTTEENEELKTVIQDIGIAVPTAVTQFDEYGKALDINVGKVRTFTEAQREANKILNAGAIKEQEAALKLAEIRAKNLNQTLDTKDKDGNVVRKVQKSSGGILGGSTKTEDEIIKGERLREILVSLGKTQAEIAGRKEIIRSLIGDPLEVIKPIVPLVVVVKEVVDAVKNLVPESIKATKSLKDMSDLQPTLAANLGVTGIALDDMKQKIVISNEQLSFFSGLLNSGQGALEGLFSTMLNGGNPFEYIMAMLKRLIARLAAAAAAALILKLLLPSLGGFGADIYKSAGGGSFDAIFKMLLGIPNALPTARAARGGMVTGLTNVIVGDNASGKEALIPFERMGEFLGKYSNNGQSGEIKLSAVIRGQDIFLSNQNYINSQNRTLGI